MTCIPQWYQKSTQNTFYMHKPSYDGCYFSAAVEPEEIAAAVACFGFSDGRPAFNKNRCFGNPKAVLDVCGGLVVVSQGMAFCMI
jgi:hypothetical protein